MIKFFILMGLIMVMSFILGAFEASRKELEKEYKRSLEFVAFIIWALISLFYILLMGSLGSCLN